LRDPKWDEEQMNRSHSWTKDYPDAFADLTVLAHH
jgi:hypothetical protein